MREFSNNTNARLPVLFLLDTSSSMNGIIRGDNQHIVRQEYADGINWNIVTGDNMVTRMDELNTGLQRFVSDILADPLAKLAADVAVMTFVLKMVKDSITPEIRRKADQKILDLFPDPA